MSDYRPERPEARNPRTMAAWVAAQGLTLIDATPYASRTGEYRRYSQAVAGKPHLLRLVCLNVTNGSGYWSIETAPEDNELRTRPRREAQYDMFALVN